MIGEEKVVTRVGISPIKPDYSIGAYRTLLVNNLLSISSKSGRSYLRIDDTNPEKHHNENIYPLLENYLAIVGSSKEVFSTPVGIDGVFSPGFGLTALRQSLREARYATAVEQLKQTGFVKDLDGVSFFDLDHFIELFGDTLEQSYIGSKSSRSVSLKGWRGLGGQVSNMFPLIAHGRTLYHLATVVDDADLKVTHVIRGSDKIDAQVPQDLLRISLGIEPVTHAYSKIMTKAEGENIRLNSLRHAGFSVAAIRSYILSSLTGRPDKIYLSLEEAAEDFQLIKVRPTVDKYDGARLHSIHRKLRSTS